MSTRRATVAALVAVTLLAASGCAGADRPEGGAAPVDASKLKLDATTPKAKGTLAKANWLMENEPDSLDLDTQGSSSGRIVLTNVCERLYQLQPDMTTEPFLAREAKTSDGGRTLTLTLRDDVTFHDGTRMTADDVLWSLKRHASKDMEQSDEFGNVTSMKKTADRTVTVTFKTPDAMFLKALAGDAGIVWNKRQVLKSGDEFGTPGQPDACSGPYELASWKSGDSITIRAAKNYWGKQPLTRRVDFHWASDSAFVNALKTGAADGAYAESPGTAAALRDAKGLKQYYGPSTASLVLIPTDRGGLTDPRIRRALSLAIDRKGIAESGYGGLVQPWSSPVGSGSWGYESGRFEAAQSKLKELAPDSPTSASLAEARKLVKEAGAPSDPVVIGADASQGRTVIANATRAALQSIGIRAEIKTVPPSQFEEFYSDPTARAEIDVLTGDWYISKADPMGFYDNGLSDSSNNWVRFKSKTYDAQVGEALSTLDDTKRAELATRIQRTFVEQAVWIPLAQTPTILVLDKKLTGPTASQAYLYYPWAAELGAKKGQS
ncbi:ABC transporter substrate-binding protein [Streptomyces endophyticus]|uniref:ABC transporter substrate-binding protein n=1 Tax=Streptomyces endophyticus TaxID=714166 RepID=A0ABU6FDH7_9ACTN|nr:ABC transporter substrate-binding protein [Streptomyces endophyticus]MEB8341687.1 ABC transporter substrate-binding protein [Streptomyces endophyticus]